MSETEIALIAAVVSVVCAFVAFDFVIWARALVKKAQEQADEALWHHSEAIRHSALAAAHASRAAEEAKNLSSRILNVAPFQVDHEAQRRLKEHESHDQ